MAGDVSGIKAGRAWVEIGANKTGLDSTLRGAQQSITRFGQSMRAIGYQLQFVGLGLAAGFAYAIKKASDAQETWASFKSVFGSLTDQADAFAVAMSNALGRSPQEIRKAIMSFQAFGKGLGYTEQQAFSLSKAMIQAGTDFAAFANIDEGEAFHRIMSSLSGSVEAMDQYGFNMHAAAVEQQLLLMGIHKTTAQATEQEKVMARVAIIQRTLGQQNAVGQAIREAGSFANQWRRLKSQFDGLAEAIGNALLPSITELTNHLGTALIAVTKWVTANPKAVTGFFQFAAAAAAIVGSLTAIGVTCAIVGVGLGGIASVISLAFGSMGLVVGLVASAVGLLISPIGLTVAAIVAIASAVPGLFSAISSAVGGVVSSITSVIGGITGAFDVLSHNIGAVWQGICDAISSGDLETAGAIAMAAFSLTYMSGMELIKDVWTAAMIYLEAGMDKAGAGIRVVWSGLQTAWTMVTTGIEGTFDILATNLAGIWQTVISSIKGGIDIFLTSMTGALKEIMFKIRDARVAMSPFKTKTAKEAEYANIDVDRKAYEKEQADEAEKRASERRGDVATAFDSEGLKDRSKKRTERVKKSGDTSAADAAAADRAKERQTRLDALAESNPEIAKQKQELETLIAQARTAKEKQDEEAKKRKGPNGEPMKSPDIRAGLDGVDTKRPEAAARYSAKDASSIAQNFGASHNDIPAKQLAATVEVKKAVDKQGEFLKKLIDKPPIHVKEIV
jgi:hypothetical protein